MSALSRLQRRMDRVAARQCYVFRQCKNFIAHQECEFARARGMRFYFHGMRACQRKNPLQTALWSKWRQRKEVIRHTMTLRQRGIHELAIETIPNALLSRQKREV